MLVEGVLVDHGVRSSTVGLAGAALHHSFLVLLGHSLLLLLRRLFRVVLELPLYQLFHIGDQFLPCALDFFATVAHLVEVVLDLFLPFDVPFLLCAAHILVEIEVEVTGKAVITASGVQEKVAYVCPFRIKVIITGSGGSDTCDGSQNVQEVVGLMDGSATVKGQGPAFELRAIFRSNDAVMCTFVNASINSNVGTGIGVIVMMANGLDSRQLKEVDGGRLYPKGHTVPYFLCRSPDMSSTLDRKPIGCAPVQPPAATYKEPLISGDAS
ncbi:hypothetical protein PG985_016015 [Apiospora marii]|uniref:uncharacterized protein n=1 Tax=Apiospora marii TaxID=335849 RepID=UPI0031324FEB